MKHPITRRRRRAVAGAGRVTAGLTAAGLIAAGLTVAGMGSALLISGSALAGTVAARDQAAVSAAPAAGPTVQLIAAQNHITLQRFGQQVFIDPGIYVASLGSALQFDVQRASYTAPVQITQVIQLPGGRTETRRLPSWLLQGFNGLRDFARMQVVNAAGKTVLSQLLTFCPDSYQPERAAPDGPANSPYPQQCSSGDPFPKGEVWGVAKGWAVDPALTSGSAANLPLGTYKVTETITGPYRRLLHISARSATATVAAQVQTAQGCCGPVAPPAGRPRSASLASAPRVPLLRNPPASVLPDLVALPSWGISLSVSRATRQTPLADLINFGATVWIGGSSPLDVEGFRSHGSPVMPAYQYFWRGGRVVGRARAGTMGFDTKNGHDHWHFEHFAEYRLLNAAKTLAVRSHKVGFCIAPTDGVDLTLPAATWQPPQLGFGGACGQPSALWVREMLPVGWGDTYFQSVAGQSFDVTRLPNGTYYIEIIANPGGLLHETTTSNDISLRQVIIGGTPANRTVRVPAWNGLNAGGGF